MHCYVSECSGIVIDAWVRISLRANILFFETVSWTVTSSLFEENISVIDVSVIWRSLHGWPSGLRRQTQVGLDALLCVWVFWYRYRCACPNLSSCNDIVSWNRFINCNFSCCWTGGRWYRWQCDMTIIVRMGEWSKAPHSSGTCFIAMCLSVLVSLSMREFESRLAQRYCFLKPFHEL